MRKSIRRRYSVKFGYMPILIWLTVVLAVCIAVRLLSVSGAGRMLEQKIKAMVSREDAAKKIVEMELGMPFTGEDYMKLVLGRYGADEQGEVQNEEKIQEEDHTPEPSASEGMEKPGVLHPDEQVPTEMPAENIFGDGTRKLDASSIRLDNKSGYDIDVQELLDSELKYTIKEGEPSVLIVHTHGSESYTPAVDDSYEESDPYRTENTDYNVVKVGEVLKEELESYGVTVLHDETLHDYPSYNGSYNRSLETVAKYLEQYPTIKVVIDLHRDAIAKSDGTQYKTVAQVGDTACSQILMVMGTDASGLSHPVWQENLKLALKMEYAMNMMYPSLAKPVLVSEYRYNQHMTAGSMILEVGCTGNTLQESIQAVKYFASAAGQVLQSITEK